MKWIIGILILLFAGWKLAVSLFNKPTAEDVRLVVTDSSQAKRSLPPDPKIDSVKQGVNNTDTVVKNHLPLPKGGIDTKGVPPADVVAFAKTQMGVPYLYGSTDPAKGFDCSGFITYVFKHFNIVVPRSSIDFTNVGTEVSAVQAKPGDLILFTGTDSSERFVGHMGIVVDNSDTLRFIHSTSGRQYGVTITPLNNYYKGRYVKTIRVFPQNG
ncbi:MAG TPA: C40 family peptidase [Flavisolibacter sp.]|nr:C40 family peptidase [Flavisolibacter sp.]